jgi:uncharacterized protein (TIGR03435 family)
MLRRFSLLSLCLLLAGLINVPQIASQSQKEPPLAFEVASVKVNKSGERESLVQYLPGGRFVARNTGVFQLVGEAFNIPGKRFGGGNNFLKTIDPRLINDRYDVDATAEKGSIPPGSAKVRNEKLRLMLQTLLADRFKLSIHLESNQQPVYALTVAKGGSKLQKAAITEEDCEKRATDRFDPGSCHTFQGGILPGLHGDAVNLTDLAEILTLWSDRAAVIDKTEVNGLYNIQTAGWADVSIVRPPQNDNEREAVRILTDPSRLTLFGVIEELGLKLEPQTAPVETLFVDHIEVPSEN